MAGQEGQGRKVVGVRKPRSDRGVARTTDRDLKALTWLAEQWGAPIDQVGRLLRPDTEKRLQIYAAESATRRWKAHGMVDTGRVQVGGARWVWPVSTTAARMLGWDVHRWEPTPVRTNHMAAVNDVRLDMPDAEWTSERVLLHQVGVRGDGDRLRVPDGVVEVGDRRLLVEVELSRKSPDAMAEAVRGWPDACQRWGADGVLWVSNRSLYEHMSAAVERMKARFPGGVGGQLSAVGIEWRELS